MADPTDPTNDPQAAFNALFGTDTAAIMQIKEAIVTATEFMKAWKETDLADSAQKLVDAHKAMADETRRLREDIQNMERRGGGRGVLGGLMSRLGRGEQAPQADPREAAERNKEADRQKQEDAQKEARAKLAEERQRRLEGMTDPERAAEHARERFGTDAGGQRRIPPIDDPDQNPKAWYNQVESLNPDATGLRIPQFGHLTVQDLLNRAREDRRQAATQAAREGDEESMNRLGGQAASFDRWSRRLGNVYGVRALFGMTQQHVTGPLQGLTAAMEDPGILMGYRRDTNPFSDILGFQTPFSAAGREGFRQQIQQLQMRWSAGINREQAAQIQGATNQMGFSGDLGTQVSRDFLQPLVRRFGVNAQTLVPFRQTIAASYRPEEAIQRLNEALADLGETARSARVNTDTMTQALASAGEQMESMGGTQLGGIRFGTQFTQATGLMPNVGMELAQNPMVQARIAGLSGLPSFAQAAATPGQRIQATQQAIRTMYNAYAQSMGTQGAQEVLRDDQGNRVGVVSGENPALAATGSLFGQSATNIQRILEGQDVASRTSRLASAITGYEQRGRNIAGRIATNGGGVEQAMRAEVRDLNSLRENPTREYDYRFNRDSGVIERRKFGRGHDWETAQYANSQVTERMNLEGRVVGELGDERLNSGQNITTKELRTLAQEAGISRHEMNEAMRPRDVEKRVANVRQLIADKQAEEAAKYEIRFTGVAENFFKALAKKTGVNFPGGRNVAAASSGGSPTPLDQQTNTAGGLNIGVG